MSGDVARRIIALEDELNVACDLIRNLTARVVLLEDAIILASPKPPKPAKAEKPAG